MWITTSVAALALWAFVVVAGTANGWFRDAVAARNQPGEFMATAIKTIDETARGSIVLVLIEGGRVFDEYAASIGEPVDADTLFQGASLSKWATAWGVMALVEEGRLDLDEPVSTYMTRWQLPEGDFDNSGVTVRRLLSHTAGLTDGLGYAGFAAGTPVQTLEESLNRPHSSSPEENHTVRVGFEPGTRFEYSGGGYTILQLLIEEVMGEAFASYMQREVFDPLGMSRTTYEIDPARHENVAACISSTALLLFDCAGPTPARPRSTRVPRTWFVCCWPTCRVPTEERRARGVLEPDTVAQMREPHASVMGMSIWGMGPILLAPNNSGGFVIGGAGIRARPRDQRGCSDQSRYPKRHRSASDGQSRARDGSRKRMDLLGNGETGPDDDASGRGDDGTKHRCRMAHDRRWRPAARLADEACDESPTGVTPLQLLENWRRRLDSNWRIEVLQTASATTPSVAICANRR